MFVRPYGILIYPSVPNPTVSADANPGRAMHLRSAQQTQSSSQIAAPVRRIPHMGSIIRERPGERPRPRGLANLAAYYGNRAHSAPAECSEVDLGRTNYATTTGRRARGAAGYICYLSAPAIFRQFRANISPISHQFPADFLPYFHQIPAKFPENMARFSTAEFIESFSAARNLPASFRIERHAHSDKFGTSRTRRANFRQN